MHVFMCNTGCPCCVYAETGLLFVSQMSLYLVSSCVSSDVAVLKVTVLTRTYLQSLSQWVTDTVRKYL